MNPLLALNRPCSWGGGCRPPAKADPSRIGHSASRYPFGFIIEGLNKGTWGLIRPN